MTSKYMLINYIGTFSVSQRTFQEFLCKNETSKKQD